MAGITVVASLVSFRSIRVKRACWKASLLYVLVGALVEEWFLLTNLHGYRNVIAQSSVLLRGALLKAQAESETGRWQLHARHPVASAIDHVPIWITFRQWKPSYAELSYQLFALLNTFKKIGCRRKGRN